MRICVDSSPLLVNSAGVKTYLYHWLRALKADSNNSVRLFPPASLRMLNHFNHAPWTYPGVAAILALNYSGLPFIDRFTKDCDIFHMSNLLRRVPAGPRVTATIHDTTAWLFPEMHTRRNAGNDRRFARDVFRRAHGLIAVSQSSKDDAVRLLNLPPERIRVIHPGVAAAYFDVTAAEVGAARKHLNIAKPYCLFVSTIEPRKNVDRLLDGWAATRPEIREQFDLVLAGMPGWNSENTRRRLRSGPNDVHYPGYVPEALMPGLTAGAEAVIHPSLYEGFGFPVAQAMAAGVALLTSNRSSLPEIAGGCALLVDPLSVTEISTGIEKLLLDDALRKSLATAGRIRAEHFRWERCAEESWKFFSDVSG